MLEIIDAVRAICEASGTDFFFFANGEAGWMTGTDQTNKNSEVIKKLIDTYSEAMPELPEERI